MRGGNLIWVFARTVVVLLVRFYFPYETKDFICIIAIFILDSICSLVICLRKGIKIKLQILMENIQMLPDENEMSVLTASTTETLKTVS